MKTIREIKEELQAASGTEREKLLEQHREDSRSGVVSLVKKYDREKELLEKEKARYAYKAPGRIVLCKCMRKGDRKVQEEG